MTEAREAKSRGGQKNPEPEQPVSLLDRAVDLTRVDPQILIFIGLLVVAILLRFWSLGARAMHHDESIHAYFSWQFLTGQQLYQYDPTFHGPLLYHLTALFYFLFGVGDAAARAPEAVFGVLLVALCLPLRRWLGRWGWLIAAALLTFSPSFVYFARFARHDALVTTLTLGMVIALVRYLEERRPLYLNLAAAALALSFASHELTFINAFILVAFLLCAYLLDLQGGHLQSNWQWGAGLVLISAVSLSILLSSFQLAPSPLIKAILMAVIILTMGYVGLSLLWPRLFPRGTSPVLPAVRGLIENPRPLLTALGVFGVIFGLLFTTFLTNPRGLVDGLTGGLSYWLGEQRTQRGDQPWFYYLMLLPLYEPIALAGGIAGIGLVFARLRRAVTGNKRPASKESAAAVTPAGRAAVMGRSGGSSISPAAPVQPGGSTVEAEELAQPAEPVSAVVPQGPAGPLFLALLAFWAVAALILYSWAGEKMPWLILQVALPLVFLASFSIDRLLAWRGWSTFWKSWDWAIAPLFLLLALALHGIVALGTGQVVHPLAGQYRALQMFVLGLIMLGLVALLVWRVYRIEGRNLGQSFAVLALALLALYTVRSSFLLNFRYGDVPQEMLVYTQTTPDVPLVVKEIERLGIDQTRQTRTAQDPTGGHGLKIAVDTTQSLDWPFHWYLRDFERIGNLTTFNGAQGVPPDADVILVLSTNEPAMHNQLEGKYTGMLLKHRWWFPEYETYKRWTLIFQGINQDNQQTMPWLNWHTYSAQGATNLWNYIFFRTLPVALSSQDFYFYVRSDLLPSGSVAASTDPYIEKMVQKPSDMVLGTAGSGPGQLSEPRGIATDSNDNLYVADAGNDRIVRFNPQGQDFEWGSACALDSGAGCVDPDGNGPLPLGAGQFNEPWGVATDAKGRVYVADTWNHRIQVFDQDGNFLGQWGDARLVDAEADPLGRQGTPLGFYGPRGVAVDAQGNVYVTDTGNERVLVYSIQETSDGKIQASFEYQWGTMGPEEGNFLEPVGITVDRSGRVYVADTLNGRVQVFAPGLDGQIDPVPVTTWQVGGWTASDSTARDNKPFLAVSPGGQVVFPVPERHYLAVTDNAGKILTAWGGFGADLSTFNLPVGVAFDSKGRVYVSDSGNARIMLFTLP